VLDKSARLLAGGRVKLFGAASIYKVRGDHDTYVVVLGDGYRACTCPATGTCSHIAASLLRHEQIGDDRAAKHRAKAAA
jgi:uncharacterized Zn finger protein